MVIKLPWSAGHEIVYENAEEKGKQARAMTTDEVLEMVDLFSEAAWRVKQAGFDAVELHAAHGYLISQFMSPFINRRIDRFGGSFENRMRFPLAIIASIKKKCGKDFPVMVRYSVDEWVEGGRHLEESKLVAVEFEKAGVAALDLSQCVQESPAAGFDPMYLPGRLDDVRVRGIKTARKDTRHHQPYAAQPRLLRKDASRRQDRHGRPFTPDARRPVLACKSQSSAKTKRYATAYRALRAAGRNR